MASEKIAMLVALAAFLSASLPMKPIRVIRLRYIRFSLFRPIVSGTRKRVGAAPQARSCFSGGPERGSQNRKGARAKQKLRRRRAPQKPRSSAETNGQDKGTQPNGSPLCWSRPL